MKTSKKRNWKSFRRSGRGRLVTIECHQCGKEFETKWSHRNRAKYCSQECRYAAPRPYLTETNTKKRHIKEMTEIMTAIEKTHLTPRESAKLRAKIAAHVVDQIDNAASVLNGETKWSPTQARVFGQLLNKVVPDLNASFVQHEHSTKTLNELSRDELEAIANGTHVIEVEVDDSTLLSEETVAAEEGEPTALPAPTSATESIPSENQEQPG